MYLIFIQHTKTRNLLVNLIYFAPIFMRISCEKARPSGLKLPFYRLQHPIHGLAVPAGAEHLLGDDGFIERVLLDDAPEMA